MISNYFIKKINLLESWLESSKGLLIKLPLRIGGYFILIMFMMISNMGALIRWPFAAMKRQLSPASIHNATNEPLDVNSVTLQELIDTDNKVLVDFWAEWCGPCVMMKSTIQKLAEEQTDSFTVAKVNTVSNPGLAREHGVKGLPTFILFDGGMEVSRHAGALSYRELLEFSGISD